MLNNNRKTPTACAVSLAIRRCLAHFRFLVVVLWAWLLSGPAQAIGLGAIHVQSGLGQAMRASVALYGDDIGQLEQGCVQGVLSFLDSGARQPLKVSLKRAGTGMMLLISGSQAIDEPAAVITVESTCGPRVKREYVVLLDLAPAVEPVPILADVSPVDAGISAYQELAPRQAKVKRERPVETDQVVPTVRRARESRIRAPVSVLRLSTATGSYSGDSGYLKLKLTAMLAAPPPVLLAHEVFVPSAPAVQEVSDRLRASASADSVRNTVEPKSATVMPAANASSVGQSFRSLSDLIAAGVSAVTIIVGIIWLLFRVRAMTTGSLGIANFLNLEPQEKVQRPVQRPPRRATSARVVNIGSISRIVDVPESPIGDPNNRNTLPQAEEIIDVMEQVQFFLSIDELPNAAALLEQVVDEQGDLPGSPWPWLSLFDVYKKLGDKEKYEALGARFKRRFNARVPHWGEPWDESEGLEGLAHLKQRITHLWNTDAIVPFLEKLLVDNRRGTRQGFDLTAFQDIRLLLEIAYATHDSKKYLRPAVRVPQWSVAA